ncbi:hypothetical protein ACDQ55_00710 [Chitinophaga sp. 30R24]|uniref:hypothetical protein n=1 Tax=Chitinophaga sp. 30R24 TaxID=3248838 RepID=UPI003B904C4B
MLLACEQVPQQKGAQPHHEGAVPVPFKLVSGQKDGDSAAFERGDIKTTFTYEAGMQTIQLIRQGKRLINYIRAIDSSVSKTFPVPQLIVDNGDTVVGFSTGNFFFRIKNNQAIYSKAATGNDNDTIKKAPAAAGAF